MRGSGRHKEEGWQRWMGDATDKGQGLGLQSGWMGGAAANKSSMPHYWL